MVGPVEYCVKPTLVSLETQMLSGVAHGSTLGPVATAVRRQGWLAEGRRLFHLRRPRQQRRSRQPHCAANRTKRRAAQSLSLQQRTSIGGPSRSQRRIGGA